MQTSLGSRLSNVLSLATGAAGVSWSGPEYRWIFEWIFYLSLLWAAISVCREGWSNRATLIGYLRKVEPLHVIILGLVIALGGVVWQMRSGSVAAKPGADIRPHTSSSEAASKPSPPQRNYTATDVRELPEVLLEISNVLGGPARQLKEATYKYGVEWRTVLVSQGRDAGLEQLNKIVEMSSALSKSLYAIKDKHGYYLAEINYIVEASDEPSAVGSVSKILINSTLHLPELPSDDVVNLVAPHQDNYANGVNRFREWLENSNRRLQEIKSEIASAASRFPATSAGNAGEQPTLTEPAKPNYVGNIRYASGLGDNGVLLMEFKANNYLDRLRIYVEFSNSEDPATAPAIWGQKYKIQIADFRDIAKGQTKKAPLIFEMHYADQKPNFWWGNPEVKLTDATPHLSGAKNKARIIFVGPDNKEQVYKIIAMKSTYDRPAASMHGYPVVAILDENEIKSALDWPED